MKKRVFQLFLIIMTIGVIYLLAGITNYPNQTLTGGFQSGHFEDVYDLTTGDITLSFTYNATGMKDLSGAHAWAELGVRSLGTRAVDFNPYWRYTYWTKTVDLIAGKDHIVGDLIIWGDGQMLYVKFLSTHGDCVFTETHLAIALNVDDIPQTKGGNPVPGLFPYQQLHFPPVSEYTYTIDATQWSADAKLYVAAHAVVSCPSCGTIETAWATTYDKEFEGKNWATFITYKPIKEAGSGIWLATDYDWAAGTFGPDPPGAPTLDMDDKLILQRRGGYDEGYYNIPSLPAQYWNNYGFWYDRDGVDQWQALMWGCINAGTYNTAGVYNIVINLHASDATNGTAYMTVNGIPQGFYNGPWYNGQPALYPAGQTFVGDMKHLVVFYGIYGYGVTHTAVFSNITVTQ